MSQDSILDQADASLARGDAAGAERVLTQAWPDLSKAPADALHILAMVRASERNWEEAERLLRAATRAEPNSLRHHVALGHLLLSVGNFPGAADAYAVAVRIDSTWPGLLEVAADANYRAGRLEEAERIARQAISRSPTPNGWDALSCALRGQGKAQDALNAADEALRLDWGHVNAQNSRGAALLMLNRPQEALETFETLASQGVEAPVLSLNRGAALEALGRKADARAVYDHAAQRWPHMPNLQDRVAAARKRV
jgi:tetratricopeptide (TPR) repeat protein